MKSLGLEFKEMMSDAVKYPLEMRIAALMILWGYTEKRFLDEFGCREAMPNRVSLYVRDIESGRTTLTPKLQELASQLDVKGL